MIKCVLKLGPNTLGQHWMPAVPREGEALVIAAGNEPYRVCGVTWVLAVTTAEAHIELGSRTPSSRPPFPRRRRIDEAMIETRGRVTGSTLPAGTDFEA